MLVIVEVQVEKSIAIDDLNKKLAIKQKLIEYLTSNNACKGQKHIKFNDNTAIKVGDTKVCSILVDTDGDEDRNLYFEFYIYCPQMRYMELETFETVDEEAEAGVSCLTHYLLPNEMFNDLWGNLIFDKGLKEKLLDYALSALEFSKQKVNTQVIACNRLLLLHGPPGTGKTSLSKALAQKIAIRTCEQYNYTHLIEINSHSLFSKWFAESGKLVMRLFAKIRDITTDKKNLVCVLIDEVESLAYARSSMCSQEPKDAMRVVNALLTQLDSLKDYENVFVFATSNLSERIDTAFLDRADIKQYIGLPKAPAVRVIYDSIIEELRRVHIIKSHIPEEETPMYENLIEASVGVNGRTLRKLPLLAYSNLKNSYAPYKNIPELYFLMEIGNVLEEYRNDCLK